MATWRSWATALEKRAAVVRLNATPALILMIGRPADPAILDDMTRTKSAVAEYNRLDQSRTGLQVALDGSGSV